MGEPALGHDAAVQARARDPPAGRRRRHHQAGRERPGYLPAHRQDPPRADLREARRERPGPGGRDRDPDRHRPLTPSHRHPSLNPPSGYRYLHGEGTAVRHRRRGHPAAASRCACSTPAIEIEVTTESDRVIEMAAGMQPDVVATELGLEGLKDVNLVRRLRDAAPLSAIVGWTRLRDPGRVALVLASGASGYLLKEDGVDEAARADPGGRDRDHRAHPQRGDAARQRPGGALARVRELEEQIRDMETQMADGTTAKAQFLANISHELRTPVTVAKGIAHVLRNPSVSDEERGGVHRSAPVVPRPARRPGGRDHRDHRARAGDVPAEHRVHGPGAADRQGGRRHGASAPVDPGRLTDPREPVRPGRRGQDPRRDPRTPGERLPLLARRPVGRDPRACHGQGHRRSR